MADLFVPRTRAELRSEVIRLYRIIDTLRNENAALRRDRHQVMPYVAPGGDDMTWAKETP